MKVSARKPKTKTKRTKPENDMADQLEGFGLLGFERNTRFIPGRKFEADFYWPELRLVLEVDGGVWLPKGGHTSGQGYTSDRVRDVEALKLGIVTVRYTSDQVRDGFAINSFKEIFEQRKREVGVDS